VPLRRACRAVGTLALMCAALATATGCSRAPASKDLQPGSYRAVIVGEGGREVPFGLDVAREEQGFVLYVLNGEERIRVTEVQAAPGRVTAAFPGYETTLTAAVAGDELEGTVRLVYAGGRQRDWPFKARLGQTWRFFAERRSDNADMAGRWDMTSSDGQGRSSRAVAELRQQLDQVDGTVVGAATDQRYLAGEVHDEELRLSRFDGGALVSYRGKLDAQDRWVGESWSDREGARRFVAVRSPEATVDATAVPPRLRGGPEERLQFQGRDLDGQPVAMTHPAFRGRPLVVALLGSWNPNSHDAATVLGQLDRRYRARGLATVGLMFEQHAGFDRAVAAIRRFRAARAVAFPTLLAGTTEPAAVTAALPQLDGVRAWPTLLFVDRTGRVKRIHTGLYGPAATTLHEQLVREFEETIEALLAEGEAISPGNS
jgi:hypothetical protein